MGQSEAAVNAGDTHMKHDWTFGRLTQSEAEGILIRNHLPLDSARWTSKQISHASAVLETAVFEKRAKLLAEENTGGRPDGR